MMLRSKANGLAADSVAVDFCSVESEIAVDWSCVTPIAFMSYCVAAYE